MIKNCIFSYNKVIKNEYTEMNPRIAGICQKLRVLHYKEIANVPLVSGYVKLAKGKI